LADQIFKPGQKIEDYIIEKKIGKGGMAELFLAKDRILGKRVVIKVLTPHFTKIKAFHKQFLREAKIQANLDNPHIVQIFRIFKYQNKPCLIMQHIKGTDLDRVIKRAIAIRKRKGEKGALSIERAVHIFLQVLEGVGFVHRYGIIHGDIKPSNILMDEQGIARIADFGLSYLTPPEKDKNEKILQGGTPYYMSPEQIFNEPVDSRSDIYSLGVTFLHMLTGKFPTGDKRKLMEFIEFHMEGSMDQPKQILDECEEIQPQIREAILKALDGAPNNRHQSCLEFSLAIKEDEPYEMYSELLRLGLLTKNNFTYAERDYLDRIAEKKGLTSKEAEALESNIRKEMRLPPLDFSKEYRNSLIDLLKNGRNKVDSYLKKIDRTYVRKDRLTKIQTRSIRKKLM